MLSQQVKALWSKNMITYEVLGCPICSHTIINSHRHTHPGTRWPDGPWTMTGWLETLFPLHSNSRSEKKKEKEKKKTTACLYLHFWCIVHPGVSAWDLFKYALIFTFLTEHFKFCTWVKYLPVIPAFQFCFSFPFLHFKPWRTQEPW